MMEIIWSDTIDEILRIGKPLSNIGVRNWALTKSQALSAIEHFSTYGISILGGDIYEDIDGTIQPNYDNWYCEPVRGESKNDFAKRSIEKAKTYIETYGHEVSDPKKIFFVLVPST